MKYLYFGDKRLNTRLGKIVSELSEYPYETLPQAIEKPFLILQNRNLWEIKRDHPIFVVRQFKRK
ncbi:MAG: transposase DNA-binding-containing protein [Crocosphaera sp.]